MINYKGEMYGVFKNFGGGMSETIVSGNTNANINISLDLGQLINTLFNKNNNEEYYVEDNLIEPIYFK